MLTDLSHLPVNWIDGMKISRKHFRETEDYFTELVRDVNAQPLTDDNFGILQAEQSLDIRVFCDFNQQITIELHYCKAVTPNGSRIQVVPTESIKLNANFRDIASQFNLQLSRPQVMFIVIVTNLLNRIPAGELVLEENPPRHPYTKPEIKVDIIPAEYLTITEMTNGLVLGKVSYINGELVVDKEFIPPCTSVSSLPVTIDWYKRFRQHLESWEMCCIKIIQKVNGRASGQNILAAGIQKLSENILEQLVTQKLHYNWMVRKQPPIYLCELLIRNIYLFHTYIQCYAEKEREEMLNYFAEWAELQPGTLDNQTSQALNARYDHYDLDSLFKTIHQVYDLYVMIFQKLAQLEFIGKRKGQNIFVIEQQVKEIKPIQQVEKKPSSRWSPLS